MQPAAVQDDPAHRLDDPRSPARLRVLARGLAVLVLFLGPLTLGVQRPASSASVPLPAGPAPLVVAGWLPYWDLTNGRASLTANVDVLDEISPFWYEMQADGTLALYPSAATVADVLAIARVAGRPVIPTVNNRFDKDRVRSVITSDELRAAHVANIVAEVVARDYAGFDVDYEGLYPEDRDAFSAFIRELADALHAQGRLLTVAVHPKTSEPGEYINPRAHDYAAIGAVADELRIMTYNWSWEGGPPGPIAPTWWVENVVAFAKTRVDPAKIMVGVHFYAYDWPPAASEGPVGGLSLRDLPVWPFGAAATPAAPEVATPLDWRDVRNLIATHQPVVEWSDSGPRGPVREHWLTYAGRTVWFADHDSVAARVELAQRLGVRGVALWRMGSEDPANWAALDTRACRADVNRDGAYDIFDVMRVSHAWSSTAGDSAYDPHADLVVDGQVDATDIQRAAAAWLTGCE